MRQIRAILFLTFLTVLVVSCNLDTGTLTQVEAEYETIDGEKQVVSQAIKTIRKTDSLPVVILTKVSNYNNDIRIKYLTGLDKEDGLKDYLLDSIYYDSKGNDTMRISYVHLDKWQKTQFTRKKFRNDNKVEHFLTERNIKDRPDFKREIFYKYSQTGQILSETEFECSHEVDCDSLFKKIFIYDLDGEIDSIMYTWTDKKWNKVNINSR